MELAIQSGKRLKLGVVMVVALMAVPLYWKVVQRAKETRLKNNLFTLRTVIDEYTFDKQKAPRTMQDLVNAGYLVSLPVNVTAPLPKR
jgi:general secretion pathway protein G